MTATTRVISVSIPVTDQDKAVAFYTEVLGCDLVADTELWPGARLVEVRPPGSVVSLLLLPPDSEIPVAIRLGTSDADEAHARLAGSGIAPLNEGPLRCDGVPPMFAFADPDGNALVYLEDSHDL
ncbi:VOC family protein [Gordonia sp. ABSL11-1]|uniref:VOC family protein n=1 Tax=Gordonia sp. ABSL11-1 TaxID=3053924 RepID=UPI0025748A88|nr:VOC family protein [Gordonia sp. ABSL11-1]MDL9946225.1 VOC family protein [Gordonia sp. ABSL11-1]